MVGANADDAILMGFGRGNLFDRDDIAAVLLVSRHALGKAASAMGSGPGDHIRQQDREGLVADDFARAPDGVAEAERRLLAGEAGRAGGGKIGHQRRIFGLFAPPCERVFEFISRVEVILDHRLVAAGHENEMLNPRFARLIDHVLKNWPVDDRQHLLWESPWSQAETACRDRRRAARLCGWVCPWRPDSSVDGRVKGGEPSEILITDYQFRPGRSTRLFSAEFVLGQSKRGRV